MCSEHSASPGVRGGTSGSQMPDQLALPPPIVTAAATGQLERVETAELNLIAAARSRGYLPVVASRLLAVTLDAHDPMRLGQFWGSLLDREAVEKAGGILLAGDSAKLGIRFVTNPAPKTRPNLAHFHLTSATAVDQQNTVAKALDIGAHHVDFGQTPEDGHIVLADPDGNEFCVIEPGNNFLAGCGFLGELADTGPRDVGLFWSNALDWPLVWDQNQETAIQSPEGGTKISWGGEPAVPPEVKRRHRFCLVTAEECEAEIDRLVTLGATRRSDRPDGTAVLSDPGGNEFELANQ